MNTKEAILEAALDLFSYKGYEATSTGDIAEKVGIRKSSLYNHFKSKQDILDCLIENLTREFNRVSVLKQSEGPLDEKTLTLEILWQIKMLLHDQRIAKVRRLMTIEQFRNPELAALQTQRTYTDVLAFNEAKIRSLIEQGVLYEGNVHAMAAQFAFPISAYIALVDRDPSKEEEALALVKEHIKTFFEVYRRKT